MLNPLSVRPRKISLTPQHVNSTQLQRQIQSSQETFAGLCDDGPARFKYLTSYDRTGRQLTAADLTKSTIHPLRRTIVLAAPREYQSALTEGYLNKDHYNFFVVDWVGGKEQAAGRETGQFLGTLLNVTGERYKTLLK